MTVRERLAAFDRDHGDKWRFLVVGVINTLASIALYNAVLWLFGPLGGLADAGGLLGLAGRYYYLIAYWASWVFMVVVSTTTMKYLAFRSPGPLRPQVLRAYVIYLPAQALSTGVLWLVVDLMGLSPRLGQIVAIGVTTVFSYVGHKYFTFRAPVELDEAIEPHEGSHVGESS